MDAHNAYKNPNIAREIVKISRLTSGNEAMTLAQSLASETPVTFIYLGTKYHIKNDIMQRTQAIFQDTIYDSLGF